MGNDSQNRTAFGGMRDIHERVAAQETRLSNSENPIGSVRMFAAGPPNLRWKLANGQALSREQFSSLYSRIGDDYGDGDGTTTFNVPNVPDAGGVPHYIKT